MNFKHTISQLRTLVDLHVVPGVSYAIITADGIQKAVYGQQSVFPKRLALKDDQQYDLASLTKVVGTMPVILHLVEGGQLSLTDSITKYLPEWHFPQVTITHLLTHTSGIEGYIPHRDKLNREQLKRALLGLYVGEHFNQQMIYSDTNYILLGLIAERILGEPIQDAIQRLILTPLGMYDSTFQPPLSSRCVPTDYTNGYLRQGTVEDPKARILGRECGSAGLFSTLTDLTKFVDEMLNPQGLILHPATILSLNADHTLDHQLGRSYGWQYHKQPNYLFQAGYTGTGIVLQPQLKRGLIFLTNRVHPTLPNEAYIPYRDQLIRTFINEK